MKLACLSAYIGRFSFGIGASIALFTPSPAQAVERVTVEIRAFIPSEHPGSPGYVRFTAGPNPKTVIPAPPTWLLTPTARRLVPTSVERWAIKNADNYRGAMLAGLVANHCFETDGRHFSGSADVSARLHFRVSFLVDGGRISIEKPATSASNTFWADETRMVDCKSGEVLHRKTERPLPRGQLRRRLPSRETQARRWQGNSLGARSGRQPARAAQ